VKWRCFDSYSGECSNKTAYRIDCRDRQEDNCAGDTTKSTGLVWLFVFLASTKILAQTNPVPFVNQPLVPMSAAPGSVGLTLTVNGTGFASVSVVKWNKTPLATTLVSASQLTATVPATLISTAGTASVTVANPAPGGGASNVMYFNVSSPAPTLTFGALNSLAYSGPLVAADFNEDGKIDLASIAPVGTGTGICVQLGAGDGSFQAPMCSAANFGALNSMIASDFNGDGKPDLAGVDVNGLHVWLGNGDGTFQAQMDFTAGPNGSQSWALAAGDFNGDGKLDLAVANAPDEAGSSGSVSILLGNGDGTFQSHVDYALGTSGLSSVAVGEFNGDGNLDLVSNSVILLGNGDGTFGSPQPLPATAGGQIITADVNGDGKLDLIELSPKSVGVSILLGNGDGTFQSAVNYADPNNASTGVVADFNADGKLDLAVANNSAPGSASIFLGNGDGTFQSPTDFSTGPQPNSLAVADFNGDGRTDLAVMAQDNQFLLNLTVLLQGTWPALQAGPPDLTFAQQAIGTTSPPQTVTLTNTGNATLNISNITVTGANAGDFAQTNACSSSLAVNASCKFSVTFTPIAGGNRNASVSVTDNAPGSPQAVALSGSTPPAPAASLSPTSVSFPAQYVGTSGLPQSVTLTNTGTAALTIASVATSPADFGSLSACGSTVAAGASCAVGVFFDPTASGTRTGTLTITDNAGGSPQTVTLSGTGQDFSMAPGGQSTATVTPGQTASYTLSVAPGGGFNQTVAMSCSGAPAESTCSLSSSSVALSGSKAQTVTVAVTTAGRSAGLIQPFGRPPYGAMLAFVVFCGTLGLTMLLSLPKELRWRSPQVLYGLSFLCLLFLGVTVSACGGGSSSSGGSGGTPAGSYNLAVTGTFTSGSTTLSHTTKLTLVVQ
jgi:hypothetical protein